MYKSKIFFSATVILVGLFLSACTTFSPQQLGISDAEWKSYSKEKQAELMANYRSINAEAVGKNQEDQKDKNVADGDYLDLNEKIASDNSLLVKVYGGKAMLPPFTTSEPYQPAKFLITADSCKETYLNALEGPAKVVLRACYKNNILSLDPSAYDLTKKDGTVTFNYSPLWAESFTYKGINTEGLVRLKNATIEIKKAINN